MATEVDSLDWPDFRDWWRRGWEPGEHVGIVAPTGAGKSTLAQGLLGHRKYVLALDPKGGDSTLAKSGWPRLTSWPPPREVYEKIEKGEPARFIVGSTGRTPEARKRRVQVMADTVEGVIQQGRWTLYVDELQVFADRRFMKLAGDLEEMLISARDAGSSVVSSFQRPANVPRSATDQASWVAVSYTRDVDVVNRLAEMMGRPRAEVRGAMAAIEPYCWLIVGRNPREPYRATRPARV